MDEATVLGTVKDSVGIDKSDPIFDSELLLKINAGLGQLNQSGVIITNYDVKTDTKWSEVLSELNPPQLIGMIKEWLGIYVHRLFNPASSSFLATALVDRENELNWRIIQGMEYADI